MYSHVSISYFYNHFFFSPMNVDPILNDRPLIGRRLSITCSISLHSCDQAYWFLNDTLLSEDGGYHMEPVQHCVGSVAFIVNHTHDFGNIHCVMEGTLSNGDKQNCSSNSAIIYLPNVTGVWSLFY